MREGREQLRLERVQINEGLGPSHIPSSPFIAEMRWDIFIIFPNGVCIYKRASRGYNEP
jgi:hypothetical protein